MTNRACPLCRGTETNEFSRNGVRCYFQCTRCTLVFLDPEQRPKAAEERAEYERHENDPTDARYRAHLAKLVDPAIVGLPPGACGLDFGCGPGATISPMLRERGFKMVDYDPFFAPDTTVLSQHYDLVTCTEAAEHFFDPGREFERISALLRCGGRLGIMTQLLTPEIAFETWWYTRQPSHVVFYTPDTMQWIANHHDWRLDLRLPNIALFNA